MTIRHNDVENFEQNQQNFIQFDQELRMALTLVFLTVIFNSETSNFQEIYIEKLVELEQVIVNILKQSSTFMYLPIKKIIVILNLLQIFWFGQSDIDKEIEDLKRNESHRSEKFDPNIPRLIQSQFRFNKIEESYKRLIIKDNILPQFIVSLLKTLLETSPDPRKLEEIHIEKEWKSFEEL